jgi:hypothetical protein
MSTYEYRVIPAPRKGEKAKGIKTPEARMAQAMETRLNAQGQEGWEYVRSDVVPMEERAGLTSKHVTYHTVLIFRRDADFGILEEDQAGFGTFVQEDADAIAAEEEAQAAVDNTAPTAPEQAAEDTPPAAKPTAPLSATR